MLLCMDGPEMTSYMRLLGGTKKRAIFLSLQDLMSIMNPLQQHQVTAMIDTLIM